MRQSISSIPRFSATRPLETSSTQQLTLRMLASVPTEVKRWDTRTSGASAGLPPLRAPTYSGASLGTWKAEPALFVPSPILEPQSSKVTRLSPLDPNVLVAENTTFGFPDLHPVRPSLRSAERQCVHISFDSIQNVLTSRIFSTSSLGSTILQCSINFVALRGVSVQSMSPVSRSRSVSPYSLLLLFGSETSCRSALSLHPPSPLGHPPNTVKKPSTRGMPTPRLLSD